MDKSLNEVLSENAITAWARFLRSSQSLLNRVEIELKANKLPPLSWYDALLELREHRTDGLRPFELQKSMLLTQYNMSRLIDRMENEGYVERLHCREDKRGHVIHITKSGRSLLKKMWPIYKSVITTQFASKLDQDEINKLAQISLKIIVNND
ncbi:MAG: MarR family transcriptional regulator [Ectothiorhodospiraceae bacterium]|nr:MarR family transcriptional regulator [Ectothiorhodospiraceae bacterium]